MNRAVMQRALEALDAITDDVDGTGLNTKPSFDASLDAITALRAALAEPEYPQGQASTDVGVPVYVVKKAGPVAWMQEMPVSGNEERSVRMTTVKMVADDWENPIPLYTTPPQRTPLTDAQHDALMKCKSTLDYGRAVEAAHGIKEQEHE